MNWGISQRNAEDGYLRDGEPPPHHGQNAANVVRRERLAVRGAVQVTDPEAWYDLVHVMIFIIVIHG